MLFSATSNVKDAIAETNSEDRKELERLRKEANDRQMAGAKIAEKKRIGEYNARQWKNEGRDTDVQSLEITGGKLFRIRGQIYFMPIITTNYVTQNYLGAVNAYNGMGCSSVSSYGALQRL